MPDEPKRAKIRGKATTGEGDPNVTAEDIRRANKAFDDKYASKFPFLANMLDAELDDEEEGTPGVIG